MVLLPAVQVKAMELCVVEIMVPEVHTWFCAGADNDAAVGGDGGVGFGFPPPPQAANNIADKIIITLFIT